MDKPSAGSWFGQPKGLTILFLTEMWEKFSFFGMRALQVYYMTKQLHFSQSDASLVFGLYGAGVYLTPIFGGIISDRWLGRRRAVLIGGLLMAVGHFMMTSQTLFFPAMLVIALGNGLFLPNLPSQVGGLYAANDPRCGGAFNIYYVGVNLGALLAPLICGTLGEVYGWHYGFGAAGIGMCLGLLIYVLGGQHLPQDSAAAKAETSVAAAEPPRALLSLLYIGAAVVIFRIAYEQTGNTLALWADIAVDRTVLGSTIPVTWFQSLNPLFVFVLTPLLVGMWKRSAAQGRDIPGPRKMALGAFGLAISYALLAAVSYATVESAEKTSWLWLVVFFLVLTASELYILPVGLGMFALLAPRRFGATTIAAWFLASFGGNLLAGVVGSWWSSTSPAIFFAAMAGLAMFSAVLLFAFDLPSRRQSAQPQTRRTT
jgi:proton-dependent oligopeptide transporter, POT family